MMPKINGIKFELHETTEEGAYFAVLEPGPDHTRAEISVVRKQLADLGNVVGIKLKNEPEWASAGWRKRQSQRQEKRLKGDTHASADEEKWRADHDR